MEVVGSGRRTMDDDGVVVDGGGWRSISPSCCSVIEMGCGGRWASVYHVILN